MMTKSTHLKIIGHSTGKEHIIRLYMSPYAITWSDNNYITSNQVALALGLPSSAAYVRENFIMLKFVSNDLLSFMIKNFEFTRVSDIALQRMCRLGVHSTYTCIKVTSFPSVRRLPIFGK